MKTDLEFFSLYEKAVRSPYFFLFILAILHPYIRFVPVHVPAHLRRASPEIIPYLLYHEIGSKNGFVHCPPPPVHKCHGSRRLPENRKNSRRQR